MKHPILLLAFVLLAPLVAHAQQHGYADQFLGIHWGVPMEEVKSAMLKFPGTTFGEVTDNGNMIFYGGSYASYDVTAYILLFEREKFFGVRVLLAQVDGSTHTKEIFTTLREDFIRQFGQPTDSTIESDLSSSAWHLERDQEIILRLREDERIMLDFNDWATMFGEFGQSKSEKESGE